MFLFIIDALGCFFSVSVALGLLCDEGWGIYRLSMNEDLALLLGIQQKDLRKLCGN